MVFEHGFHDCTVVRISSNEVLAVKIISLDSGADVDKIWEEILCVSNCTTCDALVKYRGCEVFLFDLLIFMEYMSNG
jgi:hypothetical protein